MSLRSRLAMLGIHNNPEDEDDDAEAYRQEKVIVEDKVSRLDLGHILWRKRHEHFIERWKARSDFMRERMLEWTSIDRARLWNLAVLLVGGWLALMIFGMSFFPVTMLLDYARTPAATVIGHTYYVGITSKSPQPVFFVWRSKWAADTKASQPYSDYEIALEQSVRLTEMTDVEHYVNVGDAPCWSVMEPVPWGKDLAVSLCYLRKAEALDKWEIMEGLKDSPPTDLPLPFPLVTPPETASPQTQPPVPFLVGEGSG